MTASTSTSPSTMLAVSMARMVLRPMVPRLAISPSSLTIAPTSPAIAPTLATTPCCPLHTSEALERARQSTRIKKRKQNMANKKKKEERLRKNPPPIPKKVQLMLVAKGLGREPRPWRRPDTRPFPSDDVWAERGARGTPWHTHPRFPVGEAVAMLREHCHPTMLNLPDALVWAKLEFNLQASKKEKYVDGFSAMVPVAHPFERGVAVKSVLVFCLRPEGAQAAEAAGATRVGGLELVEDIVKGKVDVADIDHFLADEGLEKELKPLLGVLREKMPKKGAAGTVGTDLGAMVRTFMHGMEVAVVKPKQTLGYAEDPSYGYCELQVGRLGMEGEQIEGNLVAALEALRSKAPSRKTGGWVTRCQFYVEGPLKSKFDVCHPLVDDARYQQHLALLAKAQA